MIIEGETIDVGYEEEMLRQNQLQSLLRFYTTEVNGRIQFWYEITGKESLKDYLEHQTIDLEMIGHVVTYLAIAYEEISRYLLLQQHIYLHPEAIYLERSQQKMQMQLCYCPMQMEGFCQQFRSIMEFILTLIDHSQEPLTRICYDIYELTTMEDYNIREISKRLSIIEEPQVEEVDWKHVQSTDTEEIPRDRGENDEAWYEDKPVDGFSRIFERMIEKGRAYVKENILRKMESLFGHKMPLQRSAFRESSKKIGGAYMDDEELVCEPTIREEEPTTLLHEGPLQCAGRLQYAGNGEEEDYLIEGEIFRIGSRAESNDANLKSKAVSRHHAKIICQDNVFYLTDLNSTNGTFLNGQLLNYQEKVKLSPMDRIQFADVPYLIM